MNPTNYTHNFKADGLAALSAAMRAAIDDGEIPGVVTLIERDGVMLHHDAFGYRDIGAGRPMSADTICRIASMTKPITSAAAMMLVEEGRLSLDDRVDRYLPAFGRTRVYAGGDLDAMRLVEQAPAMTVFHLLTHTGGLTSGYFAADNPVEKLTADFLASPGESDLATFVAQLAEIPLRRQPGTAWAYSVSTTVLGHLIEVVADSTLPDFLQARVFAPLGMVDTGFHVKRDQMERLALVYTRAGDGQLQPAADVNARDLSAPPRRPSGGGGLLSTADDYLRFMRLMRNGGALDGVRLLQPESVALMTRNHLPPALIPIRIGALASWPGYGFGLGYGVLVDPPAAGYTVPPGEYMWGGAYSTVGLTWPYAGANLLCLTQVPVAQTDFVDRVHRLAAAALRPSR